MNKLKINLRCFFEIDRKSMIQKKRTSHSRRKAVGCTQDRAWHAEMKDWAWPQIEKTIVCASRHPPRPPMCAKFARFSVRKLREIKFPRSGKVIEKFSEPRAFEWYPFQFKWTSPRSIFTNSKFEVTPEKWYNKSRKVSFLVSFALWEPNVPGYFQISKRRIGSTNFHVKTH